MAKESSSDHGDGPRAFVLAFAVFALWTASTFLLEGRTPSLNPTPDRPGRYIYIVVVNIGVGLLLPLIILSQRVVSLSRGSLAEGRPLLSSTDLNMIGFRGLFHSLIAISLGSLIGLSLWSLTCVYSMFSSSLYDPLAQPLPLQLFQSHS